MSTAVATATATFNGNNYNYQQQLLYTAATTFGVTIEMKIEKQEEQATFKYEHR